MSANSKLTTATHALCWLELSTRRGEPTLTSERIASSLASNPVVVRQCLAPLRDAGLVETKKGPGSGWTLARRGESISLLDVHEALGRPPTFALHPHDPNPECPVGFGIRPTLDAVYQELDKAMCESLRERSIAGVLDEILSEHPIPATSR